MQKREKFVKFTRVILSVIGFIGIFLPLVTNDIFYLSIKNLNGPYLLLYLISIALLVLSINDLYKEINYMKVWFISLSILGLFILVLAIGQGINTLDYISGRFSDYDDSSSFSDAYPGLGAIFLFISYLGLAFVSFIKTKSANNKKSI